MKNMKRIIIITGVLIFVVAALWLSFSEMGFIKRFSQTNLTTNAVTVFTDTTAILGGNTGRTLYTERGVVYATTPNPTTANNKTPAEDTETESFNVNVSGLSANTRYYVRAYAINSKGTTYGAQVRFTTAAMPNASYIIDDGSAEANFSYFDNLSLGNQFNAGEDGVLTSVDVFSRNRNDNANKQVIIDIYNTQRRLVGSSAPFTLASDGWINVSLGNIPYSGTFYAMLRWTEPELGTHGLGYDTNGSYVNAGLNWLRDNTGSWWLLHEAAPQHQPGVFMIRANVNTSGTGTVTDMQTSRLPLLATAAAAAVTPNSVALAGNITHIGIPAYIERGMVYCTHENPTVNCTKVAVAGTGAGIFTTNISDLRSNTTYYARSYAISEGGTAYGNQITFTTSDPTHLPALTTNTATNITAASATIDGIVTNAGTPAYTERGVAFCTHSNPTVTCSRVSAAGTGLGYFSADMSNLRANTTYYVRAFATNADGTFYGNEISFTTPAPPMEFNPTIPFELTPPPPIEFTPAQPEATPEVLLEEPF